MAYIVQPKDINTIMLHIGSKCCYREHKFKDADPRRECHLGFIELNLKLCRHCTWFTDSPKPKSLKLLTGDDIIKLSKFLASLKEDKDPMEALK